MKIATACFSIIVLAGSAFAQAERQILVTPRAEHPQIAKDSGLGGRVTVNLTLDASGNVVSVDGVTGPDSVCSAVTRPDVVALREAASSAAANAKFAPSDGSLASSTVSLNFDFPTTQSKDVVADEDKVYAAVSPPPTYAVRPASSGDKFTIKGNSRATVKADEKDSDGSIPPPDYTGPVNTAGSGSNSGGYTIAGQTVERQIHEKSIKGGVLNGKAMNLPKPRQAACRAEFSPTLLMGNPVKVSGVITYNFVP